MKKFGNFAIAISIPLYFSSCSYFISGQGRKDLVEKSVSGQADSSAEFFVDSRGKTKGQTLYFWLVCRQRQTTRELPDMDADIFIRSISGDPLSLVIVGESDSMGISRGAPSTLLPGDTLRAFSGKLWKTPISYYMPVGLSNVGFQGTLLKAKIKWNGILPPGAKLKIASLWADGP